MIRQGKDLSPDQRSAIESLLGRAISQQEEISVKSLPLAPDVSAERRREIISSLEAYFQRIDAKRSDISDEEAEDIINEALRSTRPNYRPLR